MSVSFRPAPAPKDAPKSMFRRLTTKFNRAQPTQIAPPPAVNKRNSIGVPQVNQSTTLAAREARNAALRERGLLPPLPLSVQEAQQDMRIAIVSSPEPPEEPSALERRPTAANRIKEEWEAKNRERLSEFRFGGNSPASSPMKEDFGLEPVREVDTPLPSPLLSLETQDPMSEYGARSDEDPVRKSPRAPPPTLNLSRGQHLSPPLMQAWSDMLPDPSLPPLPPSPSLGSATESNFPSLISAFSITPPADADAGFPPPTHAPGTETPTPGDATPKPPGSPSRSQSPPRLALAPSSSETSSLGPPSLMHDSQSSASASTSTSDSLASGFGRMRSVAVRNSVIEPLAPGQGHHAIEVIVESPGEERTVFITTDRADEEGAEQVAGKQGRSEDVVALALPPRRRPVTTEDPTPAAAKADRRKSLNVFKRSAGGDGLSTMMSIRRSMGLGRAKSPVGFDASALPPSPTLNASFTAQQSASPRGRPQEKQQQLQQHRLSVSPTMHNQGSILQEMSKIENEESRRMTEVAFM
ncbi:hypothetical protein C8R46DRAFT_392240 [Mycena filopes]|nr:hypothetical protein C8R46DRAFT_392240 [Mycena filopes]